ncbi:MAG: 30S ribosomal protein S3 [Candidatus Magasanikbacteria bacterium GW2011_GWC2_40_17]|uniref:Small ribosomal subunit protein uS3 n=1 Tax=Candidatus Magasanikbacteria bacterium GW2011_GWA2_42_32 TaxID=1619039 RepID=A0A0G1D455_9BACT|nr:MAG: 30S ribosomal protein S3 [Candidatus Magasanikbacteria bacterium GW2011_GWC2_40_17]KKS56798.1 MAG: 30S ribosomal protein S3 [Candidatus Magasanikbacteria bacterium GW2011_GWA2_42_32]OGH86016.1 MAG: 30S ribosomal protein S3 [Candidatus Magasanikbacteria bacterium RIFOXYB2_FULL_38_10]
MGHKVHPTIFRMSTIYRWNSRWFAGNREQYAKFLQQDLKIKKYLGQKVKESGIDCIQIERNAKEIVIILNVAKPGVIIGRGGAGIEELRKDLQKRFFGKTANLKLNVQECSKPNLSSHIVIQSMITDLEKRMPFRRVLKTTIEKVRKAGAQGVKVMVSGRLNGAEIARREMLVSGKIPLQNLRADIDFASEIAQTIYGVIGVKIWIYRGEIFSTKNEATASGK